MLNFQDLFLLIAILLPIYWWKRKPLWDFAAKIPGDNGYPIVGIGHKFLGTNFEETYSVLMSLSKGFHTFKFWAGPVLFLVVRDPDDIKIILNSEETFDKINIMYKQYLSYCLFSMEGGERYKIHRRAVNPLFNPGSLHRYLPVVNRKTLSFLERFDERLESREFDFTHHAMDFIMETLLATMMGIEDISESTRLKFIHDTDKVFEISTKKNFKWWLLLDPIFRLTSDYKPFTQHKGDINKFIDGLLEDIERDYQAGTLSTDRKQQLYFDQLYKIRETMTYEQLREEIFAFFIGAFDTTGKAIAGTLLLLAMNHGAQEKVRTELKSIFTSDEEIDEDKINQMEYLDLVIKESLRLLPVSLLAGREVTKDIELTNFKVPKGTLILLSVLQTHRDKKYWGEDADEFIPERFTEENFKKVHPYAYFPFSKGARICLGFRWATMAMKVFLGKFLLKYRVSTDLKYEDLEFSVIMTTVIKQGYTFKVERI